MMLKRKKFVIQWRKFGLKSSCIFKVMNFWSLCLFLIFILFLNCFFLLKSRKRGGIFVHRPPYADVARVPHVARSWRGVRDHRTDATRLWGHVAGPPVAHAWRTGHRHVAGGLACSWVHADTRVGATWQERVGIWRAHGLVGPRKMIGAVT